MPYLMSKTTSDTLEFQIFFFLYLQLKKERKKERQTEYGQEISNSSGGGREDELRIRKGRVFVQTDVFRSFFF